MGAAPLSWLAKIGGDTLKTKAKLLSSAINELHDDGQCKIVAVVDNTADNGKTVLITTDDNKTYSGTIANKKCEFLLPPRTLYTVQKVSSGSSEFTTKVEAGYGDCILVHLDTGYVEVKQGDIVGLDYIKAATDANLKNKVPEAKAVKELNNSITANNSDGSFVNLSSYKSQSNRYIFPSDGYLVLTFEGITSTYMIVRVYSANGNLIAQLGSSGNTGSNAYSNDIKSLFVKKGMSAYVHVNSGGTNTIRFYPIS